MKKLVTHNSRFHADDIFATAVLALILEKSGETFTVTRTRDEELVKNGDYVYDVGGIYDEATNRFDHHQPGGAGKRDNGIEYASIGLVWKKFGVELSGSPKAAEIIEMRLVAPIDAGDNGIELFKSNIEDVAPYTIQSVFKDFMPSLENASEESLYSAFMDCVELAKKILEKEIMHTKEIIKAEDVVSLAYESATDKRVIVLDERTQWEGFISKFPEPLFVVFPRLDGSWGAHAVAKDISTFDRRKDFPSAWAGLLNEDLQKVSGIADATFCHRALFMAVAKSKEGAIKLAQIAVESKEQ